MGKQSRLRNLKAELNARITAAIKNPISATWEKGKLTGTTLKLFRKLAPMEKHIPKCKWCNFRFEKMKADPYILGLPNGSDKIAQEYIVKTPYLRAILKEIIECPYYNSVGFD